MKTNHPRSYEDCISEYHAAASVSRASLHDACQADADSWTATINAFLVVCMLAALLMFGWQVEQWENTRTAHVQPAVATEGFCVDAQHRF